MLQADAIRAHLANGWSGAELRVLGSVTSTNDIAWAWAEAGCPEGTTVLAEEQIQGRGRFGRTWHSPRGRGILMSVVLRPPMPGVGPAHVTALAALAIAEALAAETGLAPAIRWPNDVTVRDRKVAGVLVERRGGAPGPCVVGMGLNVNTTREEFPEGLRDLVSSVAIETGREFPREQLAGALLRVLQERYRDALEGRWPRVAERWRRRASLLGQLVAVRCRGRVWEGRLVAADPVAGIELELPGGVRQPFRAEDTTLILSRAGR